MILIPVMIGVSRVAVFIASSKLISTPVLTCGLGRALRDMVRSAEGLTVIVIEGSAAVRDADDMIDLGSDDDAAVLEAGAAKRFLAEVDRSEPLPPRLRVELAHRSSPSLACSIASDALTRAVPMG